MDIDPEDTSGSHGQPRPWAKFVVGYVFVFLSLLSLPYLVSDLPRTFAGWAITVLAVPPLYLALEWFGDKYFRPWGERNAAQKLVKAAVFIVAALLLLCVWAAVNSTLRAAN